LYSDRVHIIVRSRNNANFVDLAETALEEESAILSKQEKYRGEAGTPIKCGNHGHHTQACFREKNLRDNQARIERPRRNFEIVCYNCKLKGHYARNCPKAMRKFDTSQKTSEGSHPTVSSVQ
jgi:hypothetical protein